MDKLKKYNKAYYEKHKKHIKELMKRKMHCDVCDIDLVASHYNRHVKTKKHTTQAFTYSQN